jgi:biuret amidohydrolase
MDRFNGLEIPESLADALRPSTLALLAYDMQVGALGQIANGSRVLADVLRVLAAAREQAVRTVFVRHYSMPTELAGVYQLRQRKVWERTTHASLTPPIVDSAAPGFAMPPVEARAASSS